MITPIGKQPVLPSGTTVPITPAIRAGDFLFLSGQLGMDDAGRMVAEDVTSQTRQALARLQSVLAQAGGRLDQVVKVTAWLTNREDFAAFNKIYAEFFPNRPPARSTVVSGLLIPGACVEIEAIAYLG